MADRYKRDERVEGSYEDLEAGLFIEETSLNVALARHSELYQRVTRALVLAESRRDAAKSEEEEIEAEADKEYRDEAARRDEKITEAEVKALVRLDKEVVAAKKRTRELTKEAKLWAGLERSYKQRGYMVRSLVELYCANYYDAAQPNSSTTSKLKSHRAEFAKRAMAEKRRMREDEE